MSAPIGHNNPPSEIEILKEKLSEKENELRKDMKFETAPETIIDEQHAGRITETIKSIKRFISKVSDIHKDVKAPHLECGRAVDAWKKRLELELETITKDYTKPLTAFLENKAKEERERQLEAAKIERERAEALALEAQAHADVGINDTADELLNEAVGSEIMADRMIEKVATATPNQLFKSRSEYGSTASQSLVWVGEIENISAIDFNQLRKYFTITEIEKAINAAVRDGIRKLDGVKIEQKTKLNIR